MSLQHHATWLEDKPHPKLNLPSRLVPVRGSLRAKLTRGSALKQRLSKIRAGLRYLRGTEIQLVSGVIGSHLQLCLPFFRDADVLQEARIQIKEARAGNTGILQRIRAQGVRLTARQRLKRLGVEIVSRWYVLTRITHHSQVVEAWIG